MDKNKIIEAATKFVQKGQYDKAIKEYQKLLEAEPKDSRTLQKVGELYQKKGENDQAAEYFLKVGESYSADGFFLKAVAVFKQVIKLDEKRIDVNLKLAELYQQLGLMSDAMAQLQLVSAHYERTGDTGSTLDLLRRMVELDPDNVASRIKLAELFARDNLNQEAVSEFQRAAEYLKRNNRIDDYLKVAERLIFIDPSNLELARELAQIYLAKEDTKRALAKLQVCFKADPRDVETLNLLAQAFLNLGQTSKTISVYKELAKIFDEQDRIDDERAVWEKIRSIAPDDPDVLSRAAPQAAASAPVSSAPELPRSYERPSAKASAQELPSAAGPDQVIKLLTETDVYVKYGLHEKALDHLRKVFAADPSNVDGHDRAYQIAKAMGQHARAEEELITVIRLAAAGGDLPRAQARLQELLESNPGHPEVAGFLDTIGAPGPVEEVAEVVDESLVIDSADDASIIEEAAPEEIEELESADEVLVSGDPTEDLIVEDEPLTAEVDSLETVDDEALVVASSDGPLLEEDESLISSAEQLEDPTSPGMMLPRVEEVLVSSEEELADEVIQGDGQGDGPDDQPFTDISSEEIEELPPEDVTHETHSGLGTRSFVDQEAEGPQEGATRVVSLDELRRASELARSLKAEAHPPVEAEEVEPLVEERVSDEPGSMSVGDEDPASDELDEAAFFISQGDLEEARDILETVMLAYPGNPRAAELIAELEQKEQRGSTQAAPEGDSAFDLAAELAEELGDREADAEAGPLSPGDDGFQISAEDVFAEFKKGVSKVVKPEDVDTHYDLGIAYREMGLLPDAIGEFEQALAGATGKAREIDCFVMIAACRQSQKDHPGAIDALRKGLALPQVTPDSAKSMQYDIAASYEALSRPGKALAFYRRVAEVDARFRDVQAAILRLEGDGVDEEDPDDPPPESGGSPAAGGKSGPGGPGGRPTGGGTKQGLNGVHSPKGGTTPGSKEAPKTSRKIGYV